MLTLGAGSVTQLGPRVLALLGERRALSPVHGTHPERRRRRRRTAALRSRRRFARRQWARRWLAWRYVVAVSCSSLALVVGGVWRSSSPPCSRCKGVEVDGASHAQRRAEVRRAAAVPDGEPLARVDLDEIRPRSRPSPWCSPPT